jgi:hypothetical protein
MPTTTTRSGTALANARKNWSRWAEGMSAGGDPPPPLEVLEAGATLQLREPMVQLERDAEAVREVREVEARAQGLRAKVAEPIAARGGGTSIRERISELRRELRELERLVMPDHRSMTAGRLTADANAIRKKHPLVFATVQADKARRRGDS